MAGSGIGCWSWSTPADYQWLEKAAWFACILLSITAIMTGAQQTLLLETSEPSSQMSPDHLHNLRRSLEGCCSNQQHPKPCPIVIFSWQVPIMLLCYAVISFLAGLCVVVYSPIAGKVEWNADAKVSIYSEYTNQC